MDAITRAVATDPVKFDWMNERFGEIEARDDSLAQQINVLTKTENIVPTYINNYANLWLYSSECRTGNEIDLTITVDFTNVTDKTLPLFYVKYKPSTYVYFDLALENSSAIKLEISPIDGAVTIFGWYHTKSMTYGIGHIHYSTREVFR